MSPPPIDDFRVSISNSGKPWVEMLPRHVLDKHGGLGMEGIARETLTSPVDRYGSLGIIPYITLVPINGIIGAYCQSRSCWNCNLGLGGSFDGRYLGLVIDLDADDGAELATFGETADETVSKDLREPIVRQIVDRIECHLVRYRSSLVCHFDRDDIIKVGLIDFILVDDRCATSSFHSAVLDGGRRGDVQRFNNI